ncbi:MAG: iron ABC transporter permease [Planctomycetes bacterium]|nr:iron ABC transporter permease [Planctomycetota bacterium]MCB9904273.1 iron ABC transporter permease [Planctomycetota bacterium]
MNRALRITAGLAFALLCLAPILIMLTRVGVSDLENLGSERTLGLLGRTLRLGLHSTLIAVLIGAPFGFLLARTDVPGASLMRPLGIVPLVLPPLFLAITWTAVFELRGPWATALVLGVNTFPLVALFTAKAAARIDARREEAALLVGGLGTALRMELPLLLPGILTGAALAFAFAVNDWSVPDYISSVGPKFNVYADEIFANWQLEANTGKAVVTALPLVLVTLAALLPALSLRRRGALATLDGDFRRPAPLRLGVWRWPAFAFCAAVVLFAVCGPIARLAFEAGGGTRGFTTTAFREAMATTLEFEREFLANSLIWSAVAATIAVPLALVIAHAIERLRGGRWLEPIVLLPIAVPAILFGIGTINLWNHDATAEIYDGNAMILLLYLGRFLAFPILVLSGAVAALDPRLEEAAELAGAGPLRRLRAIVAPPLRPSLVGGWVLVFVFAMRELDAAVLVPAANHTVIFKAYNRIHFARDDSVAALCLLILFFLVLPGLLWSLFAREKLEVLP